MPKPWKSRTTSSSAAESGSHNEHNQVRRAIDYVGDHLADARLTVRQVAHELGVHPDYLGHLFATRMGWRMSRYIAARRVEVAKRLLAETDWQVKRVAKETGHANPSWFTHLFRVHTGLSPVAFRRRVRSGDEDVARDKKHYRIS